MVSSTAKTVTGYLAELPAERRTVVKAVRTLVRANLPRGYEEGMLYGMISWYVPLSRYPETYNGKPLTVASLASQRGHASLYLLGVYADAAERRAFETEYRRSGKKLDMGKSCVRFRSLDDLATDAIASSLQRTSVEAFIARYEASRRPKAKSPKRRARRRVQGRSRGSPATG